MLKLTRELIEHYLRATGWTLDPTGDGWWHGKDWTGNEERGFPASWLDSTGLDADVAMRITGRNRDIVILTFRLGICAAAEHIIMGYTHPPTVAVLRLESSHLINLVGIDPKAWEAARKQ